MGIWDGTTPNMRAELRRSMRSSGIEPWQVGNQNYGTVLSHSAAWIAVK